VQSLHVNTIGGVVNPGGNIIDVVPREDSLLVEVRIAPPDIGSIHVGQIARLKFSAYDFAIHGSLPGIVTFISADSITTEEGESFFLARIKPNRSYMGSNPDELPIRVGMTVEADILTDKKTILSYLTEPMHRGFDKALRER
jgi:adhesin transport system membrane fusion protein